MDEVEFASLLEISYTSYKSIKYKQTKARILKDKREKISKEEKEKKIEKLLKSRKVKAGQLIDYSYFKELYEPHKEKMEQVEFAEILGISYANFINMKNKPNKTAILIEREEKISEEEKEKVIEKLLKGSKVKAGQLIDYECFKKMYEPYKEKMNEVEFADLLGINYANFISMKNGRNKTAILSGREEKTSEEEKEKIIEELLNSGKIKPGQTIDYACFKKMYKPYEEKMDEVEFATLLEIGDSNYDSLKYNRNKSENIKGKKRKNK